MPHCRKSIKSNLITCLLLFNLITLKSVATQSNVKDINEDSTFPEHPTHIGAGHHKADKHAAIHYSKGYHVPSDLLSRKGGLNLARKTALISSGTVFIANRLRNFFFAPSGQLIPGRNFSNLAVCRGMSAQNLSSTDDQQRFNFFACPLRLRATGPMLKFVDDTTEEAFCCGVGRPQVCCDKDTFFRLHGTPIVPPWPIIVALIASGVAAMLLVGGVLLWLRLRRERSVAAAAARADARLKVPLIPYSQPVPVLPANQQTPVSTGGP